jgi:hypothetical protein
LDIAAQAPDGRSPTPPKMPTNKLSTISTRVALSAATASLDEREFIAIAAFRLEQLAIQFWMHLTHTAIEPSESMGHISLYMDHISL